MSRLDSYEFAFFEVFIIDDMKLAVVEIFFYCSDLTFWDGDGFAFEGDELHHAIDV